MPNISTSTYKELNEEAEVKQAGPFTLNFILDYDGTSQWNAKEERSFLSVLRCEFWIWVVLGVSVSVLASLFGCLIFGGKWSAYGTKILPDSISIIIAFIFMHICICVIELKPCLPAFGNEVLARFSFALGFGLSYATYTSIEQGKWELFMKRVFFNWVIGLVYVWMYRLTLLLWNFLWKSKPEHELSADLLEKGESNSASS